MRLQFTLAGVSPLIMHNLAAGLDTRSPVSREIAEIAAKKGGNRTDVDDLRLQELSCQPPSISALTASPRYRRQRFGP